MSGSAKAKFHAIGSLGNYSPAHSALYLTLLKNLLRKTYTERLSNDGQETDPLSQMQEDPS